MILNKVFETLSKTELPRRERGLRACPSIDRRKNVSSSPGRWRMLWLHGCIFYCTGLDANTGDAAQTTWVGFKGMISDSLLNLPRKGLFGLFNACLKLACFGWEKGASASRAMPHCCPEVIWSVMNPAPLWAEVSVSSSEKTASLSTLFAIAVGIKRETYGRQNIAIH